MNSSIEYNTTVVHQQLTMLHFTEESKRNNFNMCTHMQIMWEIILWST